MLITRALDTDFQRTGLLTGQSHFFTLHRHTGHRQRGLACSNEVHQIPGEGRYGQATQMPHTFTFAKSRTTPRQQLEVVLGSHTIKAFVTAPKDFHVMGIVRWGMEFGLLAQTNTGDYLRINGSQEQALDYDAVEAAIAKASVTGRGESFAMSRASQGQSCARRPAVAVTQRKHRKIDPCLTSSAYWH